MLAGAEQHGAKGEMQLIDQRGPQVLTNGRYPTTEANIEPARCGTCLLQCGVNAFRDEVKHGASCHGQRRARVMRQHEDRSVIGRLVAPPALPALIRPRPAYRTKHVAPENPGTDSSEALLRNAVVDSSFSIVMAVHLPPYAGVEEPFHQLGTFDAQGVLQVLIRTGAIAIDGNGEALDAEFRHDLDSASLYEG